MGGYTSNELFRVTDAEGNVDNNPRRRIETAKIMEIVESCSKLGVKAIQLTGGGEPTVHPDFNDICRKIIENRIDFSVVSNGLLMDRRKMSLLKEAKWVRISLDAANAETYGKIRNVPAKEFQVVINNIRRLKSLGVYVGVGFVVVRDNYKEILEAVDVAKSLGVDNVRLGAVFQSGNSDYYAGINDRVLADCARAAKLSNSRFTVFDNFTERYSDLVQGRPNYNKCRYMHFTTYIGADMNVYVCCTNSYSRRGLIGSLANCTFSELWNSAQKRAYFEEFRATDCLRCMFNEKNLAIERALQANPDLDHSNFV
jgi:MoaA/NifB/PqqE/SkfB family radical SAM enzyme